MPYMQVIDVELSTCGLGAMFFQTWSAVFCLSYQNCWLNDGIISSKVFLIFKLSLSFVLRPSRSQAEQFLPRTVQLHDYIHS